MSLSQLYLSVGHSRISPLENGEYLKTLKTKKDFRQINVTKMIFSYVGSN